MMPSRDETAVAQPRRMPLPSTSPQPAPTGTFLEAGTNCWKVALASRAAVVVDAAAYFGHLRAAMRAARRSIHIVGWDIDSRTHLVGGASAGDGLPETLGEFLR